MNNYKKDAFNLSEIRKSHIYGPYKFYKPNLMGDSNSKPQKMYSVPIEGTKERDFTHVYRNPQAMSTLVSTPDPKFQSMKDVLYSSFNKFANKDFLGRITITPTQKNG